MLVRAAAKESQCILFACTASALTSKWHGEGEKLLKTLFAVAADAAPSVLFFDEIDALLSSRGGSGGGGGEHEASRRFKTEFMVQMDGIVGGRKAESDRDGDGDADDDVSRRVLVLGCTNCPWDVDDAVMRRFQRRIYVPLPDADARRHLVQSLLAKEEEAKVTEKTERRGTNKNHALSERSIEHVVKRTEGFSCSDISSLAHDAAFGPLREMGGIAAIRDCRSEEVRPIEFRDFEDALVHSKRSVSNVLLERYKSWEAEQGAVIA